VETFPHPKKRPDLKGITTVVSYAILEQRIADPKKRPDLKGITTSASFSASIFS